MVSEDMTVYAYWLIRDIDGYEYTDVTIGTQTWMVENLRVTRYRDGSALSSSDTFYWYDGDISYKDKYGSLYTWMVVDPENTKKIAPIGWHVPSDTEWQTMQNFLIANGYNYDGTNAGNKIGKALASQTDWKYSSKVGNVGNTISSNNTSGFNGQPGGYYYMIHGYFSDIGYGGFWWTSTDSYINNNGSQNYFHLFYDSFDFQTATMYKQNGYSVRLLRDY